MKYAWIAAAVLLADQALKAFARGMTRVIVLIPGIVQLRHTENTGMAFSLLSGYSWALGIFSLLITALILLGLRRYRPGPISHTAAMLMVGGSLGNAIDRLLRGSVTDMIELTFVRFAVFNLADAALCVGCAVMAFALLCRPEEWRNT